MKRILCVARPSEGAANGQPHAAPTLPFHVMDGHFNELGHRIAADALLREIEATPGT